MSDSCMASEGMQDVSYHVVLNRSSRATQNSYPRGNPRAIENVKGSSVRNLVPNMTAPVLMEIWIVIVFQDVYVEEIQMEYSVPASCSGLF